MAELISVFISVLTLVAAIGGAIVGSQNIDRRLKQGVTVSNPRHPIIVQPGSNAKPVATEGTANG